MARVRSQSLVIDASVAQAAGPQAAAHPIAKRCRDFLLVARAICQHMVFTQAIKQEWDEHQSGFARHWRRSMIARKKIDWCEVVPDNGLREKLQAAVTTERQLEEITKDAHLIEAAKAAGLRVVSRDESMRDLLRTAARTVASLREVCWINPVNQREEPLQWLRARAPADCCRKLGYASSEA